jgi:NADPH:quinone reductase-like Zn-dependent oxidoreductase
MESATKVKGVMRNDRAGKSHGVQEFDKPTPGKGMVLIRVEAAPINPSDTGLLAGFYGNADKQVLPIRIGSEGSGEIEQVGEGVPEALLNKRVAYSTDCHDPHHSGSWVQYAVVSAAMVIPFPDGTNFNDICSFFVNPLTACGFMHTMQTGGHTVAVLTGASSNLVKQVIRLAKKIGGITLINIVRKDEQVKNLKDDYGAEIVLN